MRDVGASVRIPSLISASISFAENSLDPHLGQNWRPENSVVSPLCSNWSLGQTAKDVKADPLSRLQSVQWQMPIRLGWPRTAIRTCPHRHDPVNVLIVRVRFRHQ